MAAPIGANHGQTETSMAGVTVEKLAPKQLFGESFVENPYPAYRRFLNEGPAHFVNYKDGAWAIFGHAECSMALRDPRLTARRMGIFLLTLPEEQRAEFAELGRLLGMWMLFLDAPEHTRLRKLMNKGFSQGVVEGLRPQVEAIVGRMLQGLHDSQEAELMQAVAYPLPMRVIAEMLGVPETMEQRLLDWTDVIARFFGVPGQQTLESLRTAQQAVLALTDFFRGAVTERRKRRGQDLISLLLEIEEDGEVLTEEEVHAQCVMLLFGGHETTRNLVGNGMLTLLRHPQAIEQLRDTPELIRAAVEELLRFESPVQYTARMVKEDMELCGVRLKTHEPVLFMLGAANRDERQFRDADKLVLGRVSNPHLAFGAGAHFCIGNQLARLEAQVAILQLVQRFPRMRLASEEAKWVPNPILRGLRELPVVM